MITIYVTKDPENLSLRVTADGHANTAKRGQDTVCAAVSVLIYGFAEEIARLDAKKIKSRAVVTGQQPGRGAISVTCADDRTYRRVLYNLAPMERAIEMLAEQYPSEVYVKTKSLSL